MNTKNKLIEKLLKIAKKHKVLTYPVLALVAIISFVGYFFSWSKGAGKRVVAIVMVLVMLVSQSYFLTSSATELVDDENAALIQKELQEEHAEDDSSDNKLVKTDTEQTSTEAVTEAATVVEETINKDPGTPVTEEAVTTEQNSGTTESQDNEHQLDITDEKIDSKLDGEDTQTSTINCIFYYLRNNNTSGREVLVSGQIQSSTKNSSGEYVYDVSAAGVNASLYTSMQYMLESDSATEGGCYTLSDEWYYDTAFTQKADLSNLVANSSNAVTLYCKRILTKYKVAILDHEDEKDVKDLQYSVGGDGVTPVINDGTTSYYLVPIGNSMTVTIDTPRRGYDFKGAKMNGSELSGNGNSVTVSFPEGSTNPSGTKYITLLWQAKTIAFQYNTGNPDDSLKNAVFTYDDTSARILNGEDLAVKKSGYEFQHWIVRGGSATANSGSAIVNIQDALLSGNAVLDPVYLYKNFELNLNKTIEYEYDKSYGPQNIKAQYKNSSDDEGSHFQYVVDAGVISDLKNNYNIDVSVDANSGITVSTSGASDITRSGNLDIPIQVTDTGVTDDGSVADDVKTQTLHVSIMVKPRTIELSSKYNFTKVYDGNDSVDAVNIPSELDTELTGITVKYDSARYNSKDVATATGIILENVQIQGIAQGKEDCYTVNGLNGNVTIDAKIQPRTVNFKVVLREDKKQLRTGEADPDPEKGEVWLEEDEDRNNSNEGFLPPDTIDDFLDSVTYSTNRSDVMQTGSYRIEAEADTESNYKIGHLEKAYFEVVQDEPSDSNYQIVGTKGNDNWYINHAPYIVPVGGVYNTVRISKTESGENYTAGSNVSISEEDYPRGTLIYIQLYDSVSGAVTSWKKLDVSVDETVPKFIGYSISMGDSLIYEENMTESGVILGEDAQVIEGGLYFPSKGRMLTFGSYFNNTLTVTVKYQDETSEPSQLYYSLFGRDANYSTAIFGTADEDGCATARFEIPAGLGTVNFYAADKAGNIQSNSEKLTRAGIDEWSVEADGPEWIFEVKSGDDSTGEPLKNVVNGSNDYYSKCNAYLSVKDQQSGIYSVAWNINGISYEERVNDTAHKVEEAEFTKAITADYPSTNGHYTVFATITDNAGNTSTTKTYDFYVDDEPPVVEYDEQYDKPVPEIEFTFNAYDDLSGINYIKVVDEEGNIIEHHQGKEEDGNIVCFFKTSKKGKYTIIAADKAGNIREETITLSNVSNAVPDCPNISITPENPTGNKGWYTVTPSVSVQNIKNIPEPDGTPVATRYRFWKDGQTDLTPTDISGTKDEEIVEVPDGIYNLDAWSESATGIQCENPDSHAIQVKVDTNAPRIAPLTFQTSGSKLLVSFEVTDDGSGVDGDTIKVYHGGKEILAKLEETNNGYTGSFEISETGDYTIEASDIAGNAADISSFTPMSMKVKAVTNISSKSATLGATVKKGTFDITTAVLSYRKITDETYTEAETLNVTDDKGNVSLSAVLDNLSEASAYAYKVTAVSAAGEVLEYEGYFKTLSSSETGISITGTARYANDTEGTITVGLFEGNVCSRALEVNAGDEFTFNNVPDGNYSIVATDGIYSKTMRVLIEGGLVLYPENYIDLVLSGKNTTVVITTDDTPDVTADNMDSIFNYDVINYTDDDKALIESGGTVEFKLYATLMSVSSVSANEISAMYAVTDKNKIVGAYLDLSLYKIVTDDKGNVKRSRVTELANGANISITIPLGELSGKNGLEVIRVHDTGDSYLGASLQDQDNNPGTYTITTNQFSTYAILYNRETEREPATEDKTGTTTSTENTGSNITINDKNTTEKPKDITTKDQTSNNAKNTTDGSTVGTLKSSGTAKTGDEAPIAVMGVMMLLTAAGFIVLRRKIK